MFSKAVTFSMVLQYALCWLVTSWNFTLINDTLPSTFSVSSSCLCLIMFLRPWNSSNRCIQFSHVFYSCFFFIFSCLWWGRLYSRFFAGLSSCCGLLSSIPLFVICNFWLIGVLELGFAFSILLGILFLCVLCWLFLHKWCDGAGGWVGYLLCTSHHHDQLV